MYVPKMQDSLMALQRAMDAEVIPFIDDSYVLQRARIVRGELAYLARLSEILPGLLTLENEERRQGLKECVRSLATAKGNGCDEGADSLIGKVNTQLARSYLPEAPVPHIEDLARENQDLGELMEQAIEALEALRVQQPGNQAVCDARQALRKVIVAEADRRKKPSPNLQ